MTRFFVVVGILVGVLAVGALPSLAQSTEDLKTLRKDVESLRDSQKAIQSDLQEIKNLLRARPTAAGPAAAAQPQNAVLTVDGAPFKGNKDAKIVLVDFTDYQ